jgi:hypothetical protein
LRLDNRKSDMQPLPDVYNGTVSPKKSLNLLLTVFLLVGVGYWTLKQFRNFKSEWPAPEPAGRPDGAAVSPGGVATTGQADSYPAPWRLAASGPSASRPAIAQTPYGAPGLCMVYCFGRTATCEPCENMRNWTGQLLQRDFADALRTGSLALKEVNLDEPGGRRFVYDFQLTANTVVLAQYQGGMLTRYRNLEDLWDVADKHELFLQRLRVELDAFLEGR